MNKSVSESDINVVGNELLKTPPNYIFQRTKRSREDISLGEQLDDFKKEIKEMMSLFSTKQGNEIQQMTSTLKEIQQSNLKIENSITYLTAQNEELSKKVVQLENQNKEDKKYITLLESKIEEIQIGIRKTNFVIKNVPKRSNESKEDLIDMIICLSRNLECNIAKSDVKDIYRLRGKNSESLNQPIIVETGSTILKTEVMKMGKAFNIKHKSKLSCKHLGFKSQEDTPIFLSEHLTPKGSRLHFLARDLTKSGAYKFCWTAYGKIYVKKTEVSPTITIRSEEQVHKLILDK